MADLTRHVSVKSSAGSLLTSRFSRHPERYLEIARVLLKYELHHVAAQFGMVHRHELEELGPSPNGHEHHEGHHEDDHPRNLASALEELGPCFIKLGQLLSTRPDLLPPDYIEALSRLQDTIAPVPADQICQIIESELGAPMSQLFQSFDRRPLATASIAQVHRAVLLDGQEVAVKVQRPGVRRTIEIDLEVLHELARFATSGSRRN